jgi:translation initiation factor 5B
MPPKNKGKKAKKGDDDFWYVQHESCSSISDFARDNAGETITPNLSAPNGGGSDGEDFMAKKPKAGFSAFASADLMDEMAAEDDDDDGGGLMVRFICMAYTLNQS